MKHYRFDGRLGNQMFQFAKVYSEVLKSDDKEYAVNVCPVDINTLEYKPIIKEGGEFTGYWESERYFDADAAKKLYKPTRSQAAAIRKKYGSLKNTLFIAVRRGDFLKYKNKFACVDAQFYTDMYMMLTEKKKYDKVFITSDDIQWCKNNIYIPRDVIYLDDETPENTIRIGSLCKDFIIGGSTFAWWCAWLGEDNGGEIVCPNEHFHNGNLPFESKIFFPERWHQVDASKYYEGSYMKVLVCGIAKDENHYIREWVEWYKNIGVDHVVIYDNNEIDGEHIEDVIGDYVEQKFVEIIDYRGRRQSQFDAYTDCYGRYWREYDWLMFFDIDELLHIVKNPFDRNVKKFLSHALFKNYNAIKICWKCLTDGGMLKVENDDYRMFDRFKEVADVDNKHNKYAKTILRGGIGRVFWEGAHHPSGPLVVCDTVGRPAKLSNRFDQPVWANAVLLHYKFKTIEEYVTNKMQRLYPDHTEEYSKWRLSLDFFFSLNEKTPEKEAYAEELLKRYE